MSWQRLANWLLAGGGLVTVAGAVGVLAANLRSRKRDRIVVHRGGAITGTLPCGHPAHEIDTAERLAYCPRCWNREE